MTTAAGAVTSEQPKNTTAPQHHCTAVALGGDVEACSIHLTMVV